MEPGNSIDEIIEIYQRDVDVSLLRQCHGSARVTQDVDIVYRRGRVLDLETLILTKRAAGGPKDFEALAELELLRKQERC